MWSRFVGGADRRVMSVNRWHWSVDDVGRWVVSLVGFR